MQKFQILKFRTKNASFGYFWAGIWKCCYIGDQQSRICHCKILCNNENALIWDQKCLIWVFWSNTFKKNCCHVWNQHPQIFLIAKFCEKTKTPKFGIKNTIFGYFWLKILYLVIFGLEFEKNIFIFEISVLVQIQKIFKFETKNALFGCFWSIILKRYCHIWNQHHWICVTAKFCEETKIPEVGTKKV